MLKRLVSQKNRIGLDICTTLWTLTVWGQYTELITYVLGFMNGHCDFLLDFDPISQLIDFVEKSLGHLTLD